MQQVGSLDLVEMAFRAGVCEIAQRQAVGRVRGGSFGYFCFGQVGGDGIAQSHAVVTVLRGDRYAVDLGVKLGFLA